MTPERWEEIKNNVKKQFSVEDEGTEDLLVKTGEGMVKQGTAEFVVFESPLGRTKLEFQTKPKLEEKKYLYSHRQGDAAQVEYKFSEDEVVHLLKAYKYDDLEDDWQEMDSTNFGGQ